MYSLYISRSLSLCRAFCSHNGSTANVRSQLLQAQRSGRLSEWLDTLDRRRRASLLSGGPGAASLLTDTAEELLEIRRRLQAM